MVKIRTRAATAADRRAREAAPGAASADADDATADPSDDGISLGADDLGGADSPSSQAEAGESSSLPEADGLSLSLVDQTAADDDDDAPAALPRKGKKSGGKKSKKRSKTVRQIFEEPPAQKLDRKMAGVMLTIIEGITVPSLGPAARFEPDERRLIEPSLANIIERLTPTSAQMFSQFADPVMLGVGLLIWGARVFGQPRRPPAPAPRPTLLRREDSPPPAASAPETAAPSEQIADIAQEWSTN